MAKPPLGVPKIVKLSCVCGAQIGVDPKAQRRSVKCPQCGVALDFVVTFDSKARSSKVSIVLPPNALERPVDPPATTPKAPPPAPKSPTPEPEAAEFSPEEEIYASCSCGARMAVDALELTSVQTCGQCGTSFHVVIKRIPGTPKKEVILVPKEPFSKKRSGKPSEEPPKRAKGEPAPRTKAERNHPKPTRGPVAPTRTPGPPPPGSQAVSCTCGETLFVYRRDVGKDKPCARCGTTLHFEETRDPQTLAPKIKATPVRA